MASRDLAVVTWDRYKVLTASGAVSRQDGDTQATGAKTSEANVTAGEKVVRAAEENVRASKSNLERLQTLQGYEKIRAPFAGVVTARNVDIGALISTGGASLGPAPRIFRGAFGRARQRRAVQNRGRSANCEY